MKATDRNASESEQARGAHVAQLLRQMIDPFFLRRDKATVFGVYEPPSLTDDGDEVAVDSSSSYSVQPKLQRKNDFIVWVYLSATQKRIYETFLMSERVQQLMNTTASPLAALTVLKKICDHPYLLMNYQSYRKELGFNAVDSSDAVAVDASTTADPAPAHSGEDAVDEELNAAQATLIESAALPIKSDAGFMNTSIEDLIIMSGKLQFLVKLAADLRSNGHRCLIFSQSRKMLDIIQKVLHDYKMLRIDGTVTNPADRQKRIDAFNGDPSYFCFLLTTQVCITAVHIRRPILIHWRLGRRCGLDADGR